MSEPSELATLLPAGEFRTLMWPGSGTPIVLLHGLTGLAHVWGETVNALGGYGPAWALDQRGHGDSPAPVSGYSIAEYVGDVVAFVRTLRLEQPHLVGHSMGARVAMVAAARHPELFRSVSVVDIGPERWTANWRDTVAAIERMPATMTEAETLAFFTRNRPTPAARQRGYLSRLRDAGEGRLTWRGSPEAWKQTVKSHRSRDFWEEWGRIAIPALLIRGGDSNELRPAVAARMRDRNPGVRYQEFAGVGHNIPLIAPETLAAALAAFWETVPAARS